MFSTRRAAVVWMLIGAMLHSPVLAYAAEADARAPRSEKADLGYVTPGAMAAGVAYPRRVLTAPEMEMMPLEILSAAGKKELGIDPLEIETAMVVVEPPTGGEPRLGIVLRFIKPLPAEGIFLPLLEGTTADELNGRPYFKAKRPNDPSFYRPDRRTVIFGHDDIVRRMVENQADPKPGRAVRLLGAMEGSSDVAVVVSLPPIREMLKAQLDAAPLPPPLAGFKKLPDLVSSVELSLTAVGSPGAVLRIRAVNEDAAIELEELVAKAIELGKQTMEAELGRQDRSDDPVEKATAQYGRRVVNKMIEMLRPKREGNSLVVRLEGQGQSQVAVIGILIALLLPAVQAAREAARRAQSSNNLKQIGIALYNYHDTHLGFPARANFDKDGKPLLSWRVHILPYLEQKQLYDQFHLDEPWDSEHNRKLIPRMPQVYRNPSSPTQPGKTDYLAVSGPGTLFDGAKGKNLADIRDGSSNTLMVLEVDSSRAIEWTKPEDWEYNADQPLAGLGHAHPGGFEVLFADGSVRFLSATIDSKVFRMMLTIAGNEDLDTPDL